MFPRYATMLLVDEWWASHHPLFDEWLHVSEWAALSPTIYHCMTDLDEKVRVAAETRQCQHAPVIQAIVDWTREESAGGTCEESRAPAAENVEGPAIPTAVEGYIPTAVEGHIPTAMEGHIPTVVEGPAIPTALFPN